MGFIIPAVIGPLGYLAGDLGIPNVERFYRVTLFLWPMAFGVGMSMDGVPETPALLAKALLILMFTNTVYFAILGSLAWLVWEKVFLKL